MPQTARLSTRVLVVDDEESQRTALASMIALWGYSVETACDGQEALEKLATLPAHVIVTDLNMPRMNGIEFLEAAGQAVERGSQGGRELQAHAGSSPSLD